MAQGQLDQISANGKPALVTHPPGLLERERLGRNQAGKPESSTSYVWNVTLKMLLGNKVVAVKPWLGCLLVGNSGLQKDSRGTCSKLENLQPSPYPSLLCANKQGEASGHT